MSRTAVILFNLGGPDSVESIRPFLFNFFMDKNIIRLPWPARFFLAQMIARRRSKKEAGQSYAEIGGRSPILENTRQQAQALEKMLGTDFKVFVCMRYWHPMADQVAQEVQDYHPDQIVLLPLYPQYSTTTTYSSFQSWQKAALILKLSVPTHTVCCYPVDDGFIKASVDHIRASYERIKNSDLPLPRLLLSAHGLPEDIIEKGDPYQEHCIQTAEKIVAALDIPDLDWQICYQSRVGPKKWIGPSTIEALEKAARDQVSVLIYPHAFVNEHVETLVELDIECRELSNTLDIPHFDRVPTVGVHPDFIKGLATLVYEAQGGGRQRICSAAQCGCYFSSKESV